MDRTELFDKILNHLYENEDDFWGLMETSEEYFGVSNEKLIESIVDEMIDRDWVTTSNYDKFSVMIKFNGQKMIQKYHSYSSFEKILNKINKRIIVEKNLKIVLSIIGGIAVVYGCVFTYLNYQKN